MIHIPNHTKMVQQDGDAQILTRLRSLSVRVLIFVRSLAIASECTGIHIDELGKGT
jgi:hypothetical protein